MNRAVAWTSAAALFVTLASIGVVACSNQGEGERCDPKNGNEDCASGLTCQAKIEGQVTPLCCPPPPQPASVSACIPGQPPQPDGGTTDTGTSDASTDVEQDAQNDRQDAAEDAADDVVQDALQDGTDDADDGAG